MGSPTIWASGKRDYSKGTAESLVKAIMAGKLKSDDETGEPVPMSSAKKSIREQRIDGVPLTQKEEQEEADQLYDMRHK